MFKILNRNREVVGLITSPINPIIEDNLTGMNELKFSVPATQEGLELEGYIRIENEHEYVIKEISTHGHNREVIAIMNVEELIGKVWTTFRSVDTYPTACIREIVAGTGWTVVDNCPPNKKRNLYGTQISSWDLIFLACDVWGIEVKFDTHNKVITTQEKGGTDRGTYFMSDLNLKQLMHDSHTHKLITRVIPIGKDGLTIEKVNGGKNYISNHSYSNKVITGIWQSDRYTKAQDLMDDAKEYLKEMCVPYESYECKVSDLYRLEKNPNFEFNVGDVIYLIDNITKKKIQQRIIKHTKNLTSPDKDTINLANKSMSFTDYYKRLQLISNMTEQAIGSDGLISNGSIESVDADKITGDIKATLIDADTIISEHIKADQILAGHIKADQIYGEHIVSDEIDTRHLKADSIKAEHIDAGQIEADHIQAGAIQTGHIDTGSINAGHIQSGSIQSNHIQSETITSSHLQTNIIDAGHINAGSINSNHIQANAITSNHIQSETIQAEHIQTGAITAGSSIIAEGAIGSAQISSLDANKIDAGEINTAKVKIKGENGFLFIENNTLYVVDNKRKIRCELGVIENNSNYGFVVRGADGQTIMLDHRGVHNAGITDGAIDNRKVSENANISGKKLDIDSVVKSINEDGSVTLKGTKIQIGNTTLDVKLSEQTNLITEHGQQLATQQSEITANTNAIKLKVDNQTYTEDKKNMASSLEKATSDISVLQGQIALKVGQTEIDKAVNSVNGSVDQKIKDAKAEIKATTDSISQKVSSTETITSTLSGKVATLEDTMDDVESQATTNKNDLSNLTTTVSDTNQKVASLETNLSEITQRVSATESTTSTLTTKVDTAQSTADSATTKADNAQNTANTANSTANSNKTTISNLTTRVSTAESKLTKDSLTTTIGSHYTTSTDVNGIVTSKGYATTSQVQQTKNELTATFKESGGYNLIRNSVGYGGTAGWSGNVSKSTTTSAKNINKVLLRLANNTTTENYAYSTRFSLTEGKKYTLSFNGYVNDGATSMDVFVLGSKTIAYDDFTQTTSYDTIVANKANITGTYDTHTITFTVPKGIISGYVRFDNNGAKTSGTNGYVYWADLQLEEGELQTRWSPHPSEVYDGITKIDKDGITVAQSNISTTTKMNASGFYIQKTDGTNVFKVDSGGLKMTGDIQGSTFSSTNNIFQVLSDGTVEADDINVSGTVSTNTLTVDKISNPRYPEVLDKAMTVYIKNGATSPDEFYHGAVYGSFKDMLAVAPRNLQGYTLDIVMQSNITENVSLTWFTSGQVDISFQGYTLYGYLFCYGASMVYRLYGGNGDDAKMGKIMPSCGRSMGSYYYALTFQYCQFAVNNIGLYPDTTNTTNSGGICVNRGARGNIFSATAYGSMRYLVRSEYGSHVYVGKTSGTCNNATFCATTGSIISLNNDNPQAGRSTSGNPYWVGSGGMIVNNQLLGMANITFGTTANSGSNTNTSTGSSQTVTETITASLADTYRSTVYNNWKKDGTVRQGEWGYGNCTGLWFFDNKLSSALSKGTTKSVSIKISRQSGGNSGAVTHTLKVHNHATRPSGAPTMGSTITTFSLATGASTTLNLTSAQIATLKSGKGIGLQSSYSKSTYSVCSGTITIKVTYTT